MIARITFWLLSPYWFLLFVLTPLAFPADVKGWQRLEQERIARIEKTMQSVIAVFPATEGGPLGGGSGVVISPDGYALTNFHVVQPCGVAMKCGMADGKAYNAILVGLDPVGDIALIKLLGRDDFPFAPMGNSDSVRIGDEALVMGNPFMLAIDYKPCISYGIISGTHRYQYPAGTFLEYTDCLQTDAAVNPGNSGGPLVNMRGELVGINTAIYGDTYQGIGFAIPSTLAKKIYERIRKSKGNVAYGFLGISMDELSDYLAGKNGVEPGKGVVIGKVIEGSPADQADLKSEDIILTWGDTEISGCKQLTHEIILTAPGTEITMKIVRNGETLEKTVIVGEKRLRR